MSEPFSFLEEDDDDNEDKGGIAWLPVCLAGITMAGFLVIPVLGLFGSGKNETAKWESFSPQAESVPVSVSSLSEEEVSVPLKTPNPEDLTVDLSGVDETLDDLKIPDLNLDGSEVVEANPITEIVEPAIEKIEVVEKVVKEIPKPQPALKSGYEVKKGDTLYAISRQNGTSPAELARLNDMGVNDPIKPGQFLKLPSREVQASQTVKPKKRLVKSETIKQRSVTPEPVAKPRATEVAGHSDLKPIIRNQRQQTPIQSSSGPNEKQPTEVPPRIVSPTAPGYLDDQTAQPRPTAPISRENLSLPNPLDRYNNAIAYRVQIFDNMDRIADAHATTAQELIELNGRSSIKKGEMVIVPVDNCLVKDK